MVVLLSIILVEKNLQEREMMIEDYEQEQRWRHEATDQTTKERGEVKWWALADRLSK